MAVCNTNLCGYNFRLCVFSGLVGHHGRINCLDGEIVMLQTSSTYWRNVRICWTRWFPRLISYSSTTRLDDVGLPWFPYYNTHTHSRLTALFPGLPGWAGTRMVKPIWILLKQETVSDIGISWAICKSAICCRETTTPAPHPSCRPHNSAEALKAIISSLKYENASVNRWW